MERKSLLFLILFFSFFIRIYKLDNLELFGDEIDVGYHAYSLAKTGKDYHGNILPAYIQSFSEWRAPLLMYTTAPFVGLFGLNSWSVRLPPVIFGVISIYLLYLLVSHLSGDKNLGLISAFVLALTPWHIHYSRAAFEVTLLLSLILGGTIAFLKEKWATSVICFGLSFYAYNTANVFVPLLGVILIFAQNIKIKKINKKQWVAFGLLILITFPLLKAIFFGQGAGRFNLISIFGDEKLIEQVIYKRTTGLKNGSIERIFHNKLTAWGGDFINNYLTSFSTRFLFLQGDPNPRHSLPNFGQVLWLLAPFVILGFIKLTHSKNHRLKLITFGWLFTSPIASALTIGGGNQATRLFLMLPPLVILISLGLYKFKILKWGTLGLLTFSLVFYFHNLFVHYPKETYQYWHYGYQEAMTWLNDNENKYEHIIINNSHEPALLRFLFWTEKDPKWLHKNFQGDQVKEQIIDGFNGFYLTDKYLFGQINKSKKIEWLKQNIDQQSLYLAFQKDEVPGDWDWSDNQPKEFKTLKTVYTPWGKPMIYWIKKSGQ